MTRATTSPHEAADRLKAGYLGMDVHSIVERAGYGFSLAISV